VFAVKSAFRFSDTLKLDSLQSQYQEGLNNYLLYQQFNDYSWPSWASFSSSEALRHVPAGSPLLFNSTDRSGLSFSNFLSSERVWVSHSGLLSPTYDNWSIEFGFGKNHGIKTLQDYFPGKNFNIVRNPDTSVIKMRVSDRHVSFSLDIYGGKTEIDEAILDLHIDLKPDAPIDSFFILVRPYNQIRLGGASSISFFEEERTVQINNRKALFFNTHPINAYAGNAETGDVLRFPVSRSKISCAYGTATAGYQFKAEKGKNNYLVRMGLSASHDIKPVNLDYSGIMANFQEYSKLRLNSGFNLQINDASFLNCFKCSKQVLLNHVNSEFVPKDDYHSIEYYKEMAFLTLGLNRMGFHKESLSVIENLIHNLPAVKVLTLSNAIMLSYAIFAVHDYFLNTRDTAFIQSRYAPLKPFLQQLTAFSKDNFSHAVESWCHSNSLKYSITLKPHIHDVALINHALRQFSYISRCLGLFGDENTFSDESSRIEEVIRNAVFSHTEVSPKGQEEEDASTSGDDNEKQSHTVSAVNRYFLSNSFWSYILASIYPFPVESLNTVEKETILRLFSKHGSKRDPFIINNSIGGIDLYISLVYSNILLSNKEEDGLILYDEIVRHYGQSVSIPEFASPRSWDAVSGNGDHNASASLFAVLLRNQLFIDQPSRLEFFPIPKAEWFEPGSSIQITNAPSRFGAISVRVVTTHNEIHFVFPELPTFIPPEIVFNLPCPVKIVLDDDFVLKKSHRNTFHINGWPSTVRFIIK